MRLRSLSSHLQHWLEAGIQESRQTARLLIRITARLPSVTLMACTQPRMSSAMASAWLGITARGGITSAVTVTEPASRLRCSAEPKPFKRFFRSLWKIACQKRVPRMEG